MLDDRAARFDRVAPALAALGDDELARLVAGAVPHGTGIGGRTAGLDVDGVAVFVKQVPLTATELAAPHDTGNLFGLPGFYQYGVGSAGFGAWRELTAHRLTTAWVRSGRQPNFPLLYHWRVLPRPEVRPGREPVGAGVGVDVGVDVDERTAYWDGSPAVRRRLEELNAAPAAVTLFLEHIPHELGPWLRERIDGGDQHAGVEVAARLAAAVCAMNAGGLLHFDTHMGNLLTDGRLVYFADFGLALHASFARTPEESAFFRAHAAYDRRYNAGHFATWLACEHGCPGDWDRAHDLIARAAAGTLPAELDDAPPGSRAVILRHAGTAAAMHDFFTGLVGVSKHTPYPYAEPIIANRVR
ncbi:serine/threonine protein phosphatase [Dactylosporangium sp. NPDC000244]|uniref:serine/threonine protein phosphatase n=1 Tax=Dactylosporangium sp. NPDC000244 TaxID=3154365 RepID=UPI00332B5BB7